METKIAEWLVTVIPGSAGLLALEHSDLNDNRKGNVQILVCMERVFKANVPGSHKSQFLLLAFWEMGRFSLPSVFLNLFI